MAKKVKVIGTQPKRVRVVDRPQRRIEPSELAAALGAEPCGERFSGQLDPISLAEIGNELLKRRRSTGGRPSLADATERCKVPLSKEDVAALEEIVAAIERATGSKPALGEIASVIIRMHLHAVRNAAKQSAPYPDGRNGKSAMRFVGSPAFEEFWSCLESESPRGLAIVVAAYFDEKLGVLLGQPSGSFGARINNALAVGLLTQNEHDDLHRIRKLRNAFAHDLKAECFDSAKSQQVESLRTWRIAADQLPRYAELFPTAKDRLLYVAAVFAVRLNHRPGKAASPLPEPSFLDTTAWPPVTGFSA